MEEDEGRSMGSGSAGLGSGPISGEPSTSWNRVATEQRFPLRGEALLHINLPHSGVATLHLSKAKESVLRKWDINIFMPLRRLCEIRP